IIAAADYGVLDIHDEGRSRFVWKSEPWWKTYIMEPNTESLLQDHFILRHGAIYAFRYTLCLEPGSIPGGKSDSHFVCVRDLIWRSPESNEPTEDGLRISPVMHTTRNVAAVSTAVEANPVTGAVLPSA
ncbi:MAG TPA: hypothetical protein VF713_22625, partial [Thermoanaerobaculia bacterium]